MALLVAGIALIGVCGDSDRITDPKLAGIWGVVRDSIASASIDSAVVALYYWGDADEFLSTFTDSNGVYGFNPFGKGPAILRVECHKPGYVLKDTLLVVPDEYKIFDSVNFYLSETQSE